MKPDIKHKLLAEMVLLVLASNMQPLLFLLFFWLVCPLKERKDFYTAQLKTYQCIVFRHF